MEDTEDTNSTDQETVSAEEQGSQPETSEKKNNTLPVVVIALLLLLGGGYFLANRPTPAVVPANSTPAPTVEAASTEASTLVPTKEFTVDGSNYAFSPKKITVKKGDVVKITFKDDDGMHNLVVDGYNVQTNTIKSGSSDSVTFTADKSGTFEYYCAVDSHREKGMTGSLIVQ